MNALVAAGAGFLLAVLWFGLMFDVQALRGREGDLPEAVLSSIAAYYRRVTTTARPMDRLIALVMLLTLAAAPVALAATRTLPKQSGLALVRTPSSVRAHWRGR